MEGEFVHSAGLVDFAPYLQNLPEMSILFGAFVKETGYAPIKRRDYADRFFEWYENLEAKRKIWAENVHSGADHYRDEYLHPRIREKVQSIKEKRVIVDVGCGTCEAVVPYLKTGQTYLGIDSSNFCLEYAIEKFGLSMLPTDEPSRRMVGLGALPNAIPLNGGNHFDELIASMVLHHVEEYGLAIRSMMELLKPKGKYFIVMFDADAREELEKSFSEIIERKGTKTRGDFRLPQGRLRNETIYFHENARVRSELEKYSDVRNEEKCGGIFKIFEGTTRSKA